MNPINFYWICFSCFSKVSLSLGAVGESLLRKVLGKASLQLEAKMRQSFVTAWLYSITEYKFTMPNVHKIYYYKVCHVYSEPTI